MLCGAHESVSGGLFSAFARASADQCKAVQIFTKNGSTWREPDLKDDQIEAFRRERAAWAGGDGKVLAHTSYLINLATDKPDILQRSIDSLVAEVERGTRLGIDYAFLHPGAHLGAGEDVGLARAVEALNEVIARTPNATTKILIENTAGQGTCVGHRFEHLAALFDGVAKKDRLGVCFDTQHAFASGYDISSESGYVKTWEDFSTIVGLERLCAFHLNDSKKPLGSRVDRHEHLGEGIVGLPLFWRLVNDPRFATLPGVLETEPREGDTPFKDEVALLNSLVGAKEPPAPAPTFTLEVVPAKAKAKKKKA